MDNIEFIRAEGGAFQAIFFLIIVAASIISAVIKGKKEKQLREERMRKLQESGGEAPRSQAQPKQQGRPSSIEDFLRELAGKKPAQKEEPPAREPERRPQQVRREQKAPSSDVDSSFEEKKQGARPHEIRELARQQKLAAKVAAREKRQAERSEGGLTAVQMQANAAFHMDHDVHSEAYQKKAAEKEAGVVLDLTTMSNQDLKKAFVLKEVLGSPAAMKTKGDQPPGFR
jgi:hypothetical protein